MYIRNLVQTLFGHSPACVHRQDGSAVASEQVIREYRAIRSFLASHLQAGDIAAIRLPYDYSYLLCIYACMECGFAYLPLRPSWPDSRIGQIRQLSGFQLLIDADNLPKILATPAVENLPAFEPDPESPLYIIYTSGTTGAPKGVVIQRQAYENFLRWVDAEFPLQDSDRILCMADFTFDMSLLDIALFLLKPCGIYFTQFQGNVFRLAYEIETWAITSIATVPNNLNLLLQDDVYERVNLESIRFLLLGGARFSYGAYRNIFSKLPPSVSVYNLYGPTEATVYSHFKKLTGREADDAVDHNISVGKPAAGVLCKVMDAGDEPVTTPHVPGEILIGGIQVMREYLRNPEKTREVLARVQEEIYYRTGDIGFIDEQGSTFITGRKDETLKRRGYRINLLDIDSYIQKIDAVQDCKTIALPDPDAEHLLVSFVIPKGEISQAELHREMASCLVDYQIPDCIEFVRVFPTNNSGKICRQTLMDQFQAKMTESRPDAV